MLKQSNLRGVNRSKLLLDRAGSIKLIGLDITGKTRQKQSVIGMSSMW